MESQNKEILRWLKRGKSITALMALRKFGCLRLAARIFELIESGNNIKRDMVKINGKKVARYYLGGK